MSMQEEYMTINSRRPRILRARLATRGKAPASMPRSMTLAMGVLCTAMGLGPVAPAGADVSDSGSLVLGGTVTVQGNAFSVGSSTLAVNAGYVGVRTSSPSYPFQVFSNSLVVGSNGLVGVGGAPAVTLHVQGAVPVVRLESPSGGVSYQSKTTDGTSSWGRETTAGGILTGSSANSTAFTTGGAARSMHFGTADTVRMTIDGSGNVGVGTSSPGDLFTVASNTFTVTSGGYLTQSCRSVAEIRLTTPPGHGSARRSITINCDDNDLYISTGTAIGAWKNARTNVGP